MSLAFAANNIEGLQPSVIDSVPKPATCVLDDDTQVPSDGVVDEAIIACVGEESVHPYLFVRFFSGPYGPLLTPLGSFCSRQGYLPFIELSQGILR